MKIFNGKAVRLEAENRQLKERIAELDALLKDEIKHVKLLEEANEHLFAKGFNEGRELSLKSLGIEMKPFKNRFQLDREVEAW